MNAAETIQAAIKRLTQVKETLGHVMLGENPGELYIRCDTDVDDDGNLYSYGLSVSGVDSDDEINEAILALHRTIDPVLAILRVAGREFERRAERGDARVLPYDYHLDLARAILGEDGQSVDATRLGVPAATASETGSDLELGEDGQ